MSVRVNPRVPRARRDPQQRRWSVVYGIPTLPVDGEGRVVPGAPPVVGYIGQSVQTVKQREDQHRADQPFGNIICGGSWVIEEGFWTQDELDARERHYIRHGAVLVPGQPAQRPVYNYEFNLDNPRRIEKWRAVEHRHLREPGWQPSAGRVDVQETGVDWAGRGWWLARRPVTWWTLAAVVFALWVGSLPRATWWDGAVYAACITSTVAGLRMPRRRRGRRR